MRNARSARGLMTLGATLIAVITSSQSFAGISGGDAAGITGGDVLGITGGDAAGITGGDVFGITGGDAAGITGGDVFGITGGDAAGITGGDAAGITGGDGTVLAGPVDSIDRINGVFESMGQIVMASQSMLSGMQVGDYVTVGGTAISSGWYFADAVNVSDLSYVPGATEVFISGMMSSLDLVNGTAEMGGLTIDYTSSLGGSNAPSGDMWSFHGTRPSLGGSLISTRTAGVK